MHGSYQDVVEDRIDKVLSEIQGNRCLLFLSTASITSGMLGSAFVVYNLAYLMQ